MKKIIKKLFTRFGYSIKRLESVSLLFNQRDFLLCKLCSQEKKYEKGLSCIIFSKDRAIQLFALIESLQKKCIGINQIYVIYTCSSDEHNESYSRLESELSHISSLTFFKEQGGFKESLMNILAKITFNKLMFLVDDNIFIRLCDLRFVSSIEMNNIVISPRLGINISYSYTSNKKLKQPVLKELSLIKNFYEFNWDINQAEWGDPCSLDGNIYNTALLQIIIPSMDFSGPNSFEASFKTYDSFFLRKNGICPEKSLLVNLALNRVQVEYNNRYGNITVLFLLEKWKSGHKICLDTLNDIISDSTHTEIDLKYVER